jgi:hypothetical protein
MSNSRGRGVGLPAVKYCLNARELNDIEAKWAWEWRWGRGG